MLRILYFQLILRRSGRVTVIHLAISGSLRSAGTEALLDDPDLLPRLRTGVRPPLPMEEHAAELEVLYAQLVDRNPTSW